MNRRRWLIAGQSLLGVALLIVWLLIVDLDAVAQTLRSAQWAFVALAAGLAVTSTVVRAVRWRIVLRPIASVAQVDVWLISLGSSLINFVIPIRSGEIARSLFLKQRDSVPISASLPTVAVDRSFDMLAVLLIGAIGIISGLRLGGSLSIVLALGAGLFLGFATFVVLAIFWPTRSKITLARCLIWGVRLKPGPTLLAEISSPGTNIDLHELTSGMGLTSAQAHHSTSAPPYGFRIAYKIPKWSVYVWRAAETSGWANVR